MKKTLLAISIGALALGSCSKIDPEKELTLYKDCVVCSIDTVTSAECLTNYASIAVKADLASTYFMVDFKDFKLTPGGNLLSGTMSRLVQFMDNETDNNNNTTKVNYAFFQQRPETRQSGDLDMKDMRLGWLSTTYWLNFTSGPCKVWSIPARIPLYANRNTVNSPYGINTENALSPRYDMSINTDKRTVTFKATGVRYPVDNQDVTKSWSFRQFNLADIPFTLTDKGFTFSADEFVPSVDGSTTDYTITNLQGTFEYAYEGRHQISFYITNNKTNMKLHVTTMLDYFLQSPL